MGHSALGASARNLSFTFTQQGAAGKARIWRLSFFRAATASLHLEDMPTYIINGYVQGSCQGKNSNSPWGNVASGNLFRFFPATVLKLRNKQVVSIETTEFKS
jgi:hypothetical protein